MILAVGCPRISAPQYGYVTQDGMTASVKCNDTQETWYLTCKDNDWIGDIGNCTQGSVIVKPSLHE